MPKRSGGVDFVAPTKKSRNPISDLIDKVERIREELLAIQNSLEHIESAKKSVPDKSGT